MALFTMLLDHIGLSLLPGFPVLRLVGRVSFALYCFLLVEGYVYTRSRRAYLARLLLTALLSEIPFDLFLFAQPFSPLEQNVLFTLSLSLCALWCADAYGKNGALSMLLVLLLCLAAMLARLSYAWLGALLCLCFYAYRDRPLARAAGFAGLEALYSFSLLCAGEPLSWALSNLCSLAALLPISLYNRKSGPRAFRVLFYAAYPLSLLALYLLRAARIIPPYFGIA